MKLSAAVLDEIASTLRKLSQLGISVTEFEVQGFLVSIVKDYSDSMDGSLIYYASAIRPKMVMRPHGVSGVRGIEAFDPAD